MTPETGVPTALAHLDAAEAAAHAENDQLLAADIRYSRTTLTLACGISDAVPAVAASDVMSHLESAAATLEGCVGVEPAAGDFQAVRAEIRGLLRRDRP